ncbi:uncharacterized protein LOC114273987 [Camellia sinensis]|uniref:uncharacterized protein LOC114273987 n=1 Tax=Camellia sinensis TaxID=4442 RepID=UPI0010364725|nr:uncharacterized protein LOC114273987 [Camellia sinensis]
MKEEGLVKAENPPEMFNALDVNHDGSLDFKEVMALYYVIKSGRPFCGGCGKFIPGMFFSFRYVLTMKMTSSAFAPSVLAMKIKVTPTNICPGHFLDNFALLEAKRKMTMDTRKPPPSPEEPKYNAMQ